MISVYDLWMNNSNCTVDPVGSGSDYSGFIQYLGISSLDLRFSSKEGPYGVYHSKYDDAIWYERFADPDYATSITLTRLWTVLSMAFTDSGLVPLRITPYAMALKSYVEKLKRDIVDPASLKSVDDAVCQFLNAAKTIDLEADSLASTNDPKAVADLNDRLALVERKFLMNEALPGRQEMYYRHSIYAPGLYEGYGASVLPGLKYAVDSGNSTLFQQQSEILKDCIFNASSFLKGN